jgi:hypothetical protein
MSSTREPIAWGRVFGALFLSLPFFVFLGGAAMNLCINTVWDGGLPSRFDWQEAQLDLGAYPVCILVGAPFVLLVVGMPVAAILAAALRRVHRRWVRLVVHAVVGTIVGTLVYVGYSFEAFLHGLPMGIAAGSSTVLGTLTAAAICNARDRRRARRLTFA